jgi:hypothetical protein
MASIRTGDSNFTEFAGTANPVHITWNNDRSYYEPATDGTGSVTHDGFRTVSCEITIDLCHEDRRQIVL